MYHVSPSQPLDNIKSNLSSCVFSLDVVNDEQDNEVSSEESDSGDEHPVEPPTGHHEDIMEFSSAPCTCVYVHIYGSTYIRTYMYVCMYVFGRVWVSTVI